MKNQKISKALAGLNLIAGAGFLAHSFIKGDLVSYTSAILLGPIAFLWWYVAFLQGEIERWKGTVEHLRKMIFTIVTEKEEKSASQHSEEQKTN